MLPLTKTEDPEFLRYPPLQGLYSLLPEQQEFQFHSPGGEGLWLAFVFLRPCFPERKERLPVVPLDLESSFLSNFTEPTSLPSVSAPGLSSSYHTLLARLSAACC